MRVAQRRPALFCEAAVFAKRLVHEALNQTSPLAGLIRADMANDARSRGSGPPDAA